MRAVSSSPMGAGTTRERLFMPWLLSLPFVPALRRYFSQKVRKLPSAVGTGISHTEARTSSP